MLLDNNRPKSSQSKPSSASFSKLVDFEQIAENIDDIEEIDISAANRQASLTSKSDRHSKDGKRNRFGLRAKATLLAIAIGTLPVFTVGAIAYYFTSSQSNRSEIQAQETIAVGQAEQVSSFMKERHDDLEFIANLSILSVPKLRETSTLDEKRAVLDAFIKSSGIYKSIRVFDLQGDPVVQSSGRQFTGNYSQGRPYFTEVIQTGKTLIRQPGMSKSDGEIVVEMFTPIFEAGTGKIIYVARMSFAPIHLDKLLRDRYADVPPEAEGSEQQFHIIDNNFKVFVAREGSQVLGEDMMAAIPVLKEMSSLKKTNSRVGFDTSDSDQQVITYVPIKSLDRIQKDLNWGILLHQDSKVVFATSNQLQQTLAIGTVVSALLVAVLAAWLANRATRPIQIAASAVEKIGEGELSVRIPERLLSSDEIGMLGSNINNMAAQIQQRTLISSLALRMRESTDLFAALDTLVREARQMLEADRVVIYRFKSDRSGVLAHEAVLSGLPSALREAVTDPCISPELLEAYRQGRVVVNDNVSERGYHPAHKQLLQRLQVKANLVAPIVQQGQLFGLLVAHHCTRTHVWQPNEIELIKELAVQTGYAIEQILFVEQKAKVAEIKERLSEIALKMGKTLTLQEILNTAVEEVRLALKADRAIVYNFDADWKGTIAAESVDNRWPKSLGAQIHDPCFADRYVEKYRNGRVQATSNIYDANLTECHLKQLEPFAVKANLVAPILRNKELIGLLIVHQCDAPREWDENEIELLRQLAVQLGYTVEQATVVEQIEKARLEARSEADARAEAQKQEKELLQKRALELLMEVDPVSKGDLTVRAKVTEDEIGTVADSYNATIRNLRQIVEQVQSATQAVSQTTADSEPKVKSMATEAVRQVEAIAAALAQIETMSKSSQGVAARAKTATEQVQIASQVVQAGDAAMNRTVSSIATMQSTVSDAAKKVKQLGESSQKISKVVKLIRNIAAQTNMLALNASIEAARAGEEGQGFAVVAEQVRALAQRSASATTEIGQIIEEIQAQTNEVVLAMETGTEQVNTGSHQVEEARQQLAQIAGVSAQVNKLVQEIARAATTQTQVSSAVGQTIKDVAEIASNTQTQSGSVADSFSNLLAVAKELQISVAQFKVS